jgi:hypothetical protein
MLLYDPPFLMVGDVVVYRDSALRETFYWLKSVPSLVVGDDSPAFWASVFLPPAAVAAGRPDDVSRTTVSFDVELTLPADVGERVREEIRRRWGVAPRHFSPVPLAAGQTNLSIATTAENGVGTDLFVHSGHAPSLVAGNRAAFAVAAEGREARIIAASLLSGHLAAVVSYHLEYPGIAPTFSARMQVNWQAVYSKFRERDADNFIFVTDEVERTIESLEESRAIEVEVLELDPDGAGAATRALFDQLREQVVQRLFDTPVQLGQVPVEERIAAGIRDIGSSLLPGRHHILRTLDQSALSRTSIDLSEQRVRNYSFHAQSTLAGLVRGIPDLGERVAFVDLGALPLRVESIRVELAAGSEAFGVRFAEIDVTVSDPESGATLIGERVILSPAEDQPTLLNYRRTSAREPLASYTVTLHLDPERAPGGREVLRFDPRPLSGDRIWINPEEWLDLVTLRVMVDDASLFALPASLDVEIETLSALPDAPPRRALLSLSAETTEARHAVIVEEDREASFRLREIFRRQGEQDFVRDFEPVSPGNHRIMNPFGQSWQMRVMAVADWTVSNTLFAEFRVWDVERELFLRDEHSFNEQSQEFILAFSTSLATPRKAEVRLTRFTHSGELVNGPWQDLTGPMTVVRDSIQAQRRIRAVLLAPHFEALDLKKVWLELEYEDQEHDLDLEQDLEFSGDRSSRDWTHPFPDPTHAKYRFRLRARSRAGDRFDQDWRETSLDSLRLHLPDDPF